jgi:hypothetical protein
MKNSDNYKLLDDTGNVVAMGTQNLIFSFLKHHSALPAQGWDRRA